MTHMKIDRNKYRYHYKNAIDEMYVIENVHEVSLFNGERYINLHVGKFANRSGEIVSIQEIFEFINCAWSSPSGYPTMKRRGTRSPLRLVQIEKKHRVIRMTKNYKSENTESKLRVI